MFSQKNRHVRSTVRILGKSANASTEMGPESSYSNNNQAAEFVMNAVPTGNHCQLHNSLNAPPGLPVTLVEDAPRSLYMALQG